MRKIKFKEISMITGILKELGLKEYKKELLDNIKLDHIELIQDENEKITAIEAAKKAVAIDVVIHVIEEYDKAENKLFNFFSSYKDMPVDEVKEKDIDWVIEVAKEIYNNGLPSVIKSFLKLEDVEKEIKKKMELA